MTLRRRLVIAVSALGVVLVVAGVAVLGVQRSFLLGRLDAELVALSQNPRAMLALSERVQSGSAEPSGTFAEVYVGRMGPGGRLVTLLAPTSDPTLRPRVGADEMLASPVGRATVSGEARRVRVMTAPLRNSAVAVLAIPTTGVEAATRRLALALGLAGLAVVAALGLLLSWVDRLGLRPIAAMTEAADAITRGETDRRVPLAPAGTEAERLGRALNTMIDTSTAAEERTRRFVADASHELRTPLTSIQGYAALHTTAATSPELPPSVQDALRRIGDESRRMNRIVEHLLDLTRLDEGGPARTERVEVPAILTDVAADLRVVAPDREITVTADTPLAVRGDRDRLTQAVVALGANAVRHTPPGTPVDLAAFSGDGVVRIEVSDAGPGIPAEHLPHLFERFYRVDAGRDAGRGGGGLGLAIVEAIVQAHGGSVGATSTLGQGSTFTITLPSA